MRRMRLIIPVFTWLAGMALLILIIAYLAGAFRTKVNPGVVPAPDSMAPAFTATETVREETEPLLERTPGTLSALRDTMVSARIMARIEEIAVRAGDPVEVDQLLVRLDSQDLSSRVGQAGQTAAAARAQLTEAEKEHKRVQALVKDGVAAPSALDAAEAAFTSAKANLARSEQAINEADIGRNWATIQAPFAGRVVDRYAEPGDTAMPGQALLKIYDPSRMRLETYVRESLAGTLKPGDTLQVQIDALNQQVDGRVEEIVPQSEPGSRSVLVKVALPQRPDLFPGMFGRLLIPAGEAKRRYLPQGAIQQAGQLSYVWVIADRQAAQRRFVKLGNRIKDGWVEVISGIEPNEKVGLAG